MNLEIKKGNLILFQWMLVTLSIYIMVYIGIWAASLNSLNTEKDNLIISLTEQLSEEVTDNVVLHNKANKFLSLLLEEPVNIELLTMYSTEVTVTAYTAREEECNSEPWFTACGELSRPGIIALSRDLETDFGIGMHKRVHVGEFGLYPAKDRMANFKRKDTDNPVKIVKSVDLLFANLEAAKRFTPRKVTLTWFSHKEK